MVVGQIRLDRNAIRNRSRLALVRVETAGLFDGDPTLAVSVEYLRQRLHVLGRRLDTQLYPVVRHQSPVSASFTLPRMPLVGAPFSSIVSANSTNSRSCSPLSEVGISTRTVTI